MKLLIIAALVAVAFAQYEENLVQEDGPTPADQPLGPSEADQPRGPGQVSDPAPAAFAANIAAAPSSNEASLNKANAIRQHGVNRQALYYGASAGTAPYYGVPGTSVKGVHNGAYHGAYGYGNRGAYGYGNRGAYGYGRHGGYGGYGHVGGYGGGYGQGYYGGYGVARH